MSKELNSCNRGFKYIELFLQWRGRLNTKNLMVSLDISRQSASKIIAAYKNLHPNTLSYNASKKSYEPTDQFVPKIEGNSLQKYVSLFHQGLYPLSASIILDSGHSSPSPDIVRAIVRAIELHQRLDIAYASINSPSFEERIIAPHALIYDGRRWHARAWCEKNQKFRDFVITRIREVFSIEGETEYCQSCDEGWNTWVDIIVKPDPRLSEECKSIVAMDYDMKVDTFGILKRTYKVRGAMVLYWLQQLRLDTYSDKPESQQIILSDECINMIEKWI